MKWTLFVSHPSEFKLLTEMLRGMFPNECENQESAIGGRVTTCGADGPAVALVPEDTATFRAVIEWTHRKLHPKALISTGSVMHWHSEGETFFAPSLALRTVGRVHEASHLLYEELPFDPELQTEFRKLIPAQEGGGKLLSSSTPLTNPQLQNFLTQHLDVHTGDKFSGELLVMGKRFSVRVGCLKFLIENEPTSASLKALESCWEIIFKSHLPA